MIKSLSICMAVFISCSVLGQTSHAEDLHDTTFLSVNLQSDKMFEQNADFFIQYVYPKEYEKYRNNEFDWREQKPKLLKQIQDRAKKRGNVDMRSLYGRNEFGEYDFKKQLFPMKISEAMGVDIRDGNATYKVYFANLAGDNLDLSIKMNKEDAKKLLSRSRYRNAYLIFNFKILGLAYESPFKFYAQIERVDVYADKDYSEYLFSKELAPATKVQIDQYKKPLAQKKKSQPKKKDPFNPLGIGSGGRGYGPPHF